MEVAIFTSHTENGGGIEELQEEVNDWLEKNPDIDIVDTKQSESSTCSEDTGKPVIWTHLTFTIIFKEPPKRSEDKMC